MYCMVFRLSVFRFGRFSTVAPMLKKAAEMTLTPHYILILGSNAISRTQFGTAYEHFGTASAFQRNARAFDGCPHESTRAYSMTGCTRRRAHSTTARTRERTHATERIARHFNSRKTREPRFARLTPTHGQIRCPRSI